MIHEKVHNVNLQLPKIICDQKLDPSRKQIKYPLPNTAGYTMLICGRPGSGKTSFMYSLIGNKKKGYNKVYDKVHVVMNPNSRSSLKGGFKNHKRVYDELSIENLEHIIEEAKEISSDDKSKSSLMILDDVGAELKNNDLQKILKSSQWNRRHNCLSTMFLLQSYKSLPLDIRKVASHLCLWKSTNSHETDLVHEELLSFLTKDEWFQIQRHCYRTKHDFIYAILDEQKLFRVSDQTFYELII